MRCALEPGPPPASEAARRRPTEARAWRPAWAWTGEAFVRGAEIAVDGDGALIEARGLPIRERPGIFVPGLINAHTHLELGPVTMPAGLGVPAWVSWLRAGAPPSAAQAGRGVHAAIQSGTAALGEISNTGQSFGVIRSAGLASRCFHEVLGIDVTTLPPARGRQVPHAPHSTSAALIRACAAVEEPWSIHVDEGEDERTFLATGTGIWADFMRGAGRDLTQYQPSGLTPVAYLASLGVLSPRALLVHCTLTAPEDLDTLASSGAHVALCVRSNQFISGRVPDVRGMLARGIPLAVGTDSLASSPDLDLLAEGTALAAAFPDVDVAVWMRALTVGGADALALPMGRLTGRPGLLHIDCPDPQRLFDGTRWPRRWLACP